VQGEAEKPEVSVEIVFLELRKPTLTRRRQYDN